VFQSLLRGFSFAERVPRVVLPRAETEYTASEVRHRSEIGAPFERHIQAGSLHAYLAYVLVLGVILLWWLGGLP